MEVTKMAGDKSWILGKPYTRDIRRSLTDEDRVLLSRRQREKVMELKAHEEHAKKVRSDLAATSKRLKAEQLALAEADAEGFELRPVEVRLEADLEQGIAFERDMETGERIEESVRVLTHEERQTLTGTPLENFTQAALPLRATEHERTGGEAEGDEDFDPETPATRSDSPAGAAAVDKMEREAGATYGTVPHEDLPEYEGGASRLDTPENASRMADAASADLSDASPAEDEIPFGREEPAPVSGGPVAFEVRESLLFMPDPSSARCMIEVGPDEFGPFVLRDAATSKLLAHVQADAATKSWAKSSEGAEVLREVERWLGERSDARAYLLAPAVRAPAPRPDDMRVPATLAELGVSEDPEVDAELAELEGAAERERMAGLRDANFSPIEAPATASTPEQLANDRATYDDFRPAGELPAFGARHMEIVEAPASQSADTLAHPLDKLADVRRHPLGLDAPHSSWDLVEKSDGEVYLHHRGTGFYYGPTRWNSDASEGGRFSVNDPRVEAAVPDKVAETAELAIGAGIAPRPLSHFSARMKIKQDRLRDEREWDKPAESLAQAPSEPEPTPPGAGILTPSEPEKPKRAPRAKKAAAKSEPEKPAAKRPAAKKAAAKKPAPAKAKRPAPPTPADVEKVKSTKGKRTKGAGAASP